MTKAEQVILHYPRLDTVLMIEETIKKAKTYPNKAQLFRSLPKKMMYQTFNLVLDYLRRSNKILIDKDSSIVWIFVDSPRLERLVSRSVRVRRCTK